MKSQHDGELTYVKLIRHKIMYSILSLLGAGIPVTAWAQERPYDYGWGHPMWGAWGPWGIGMMLMMLVFWGLVIVGLVLGIRWLIAQGKDPRTDSPLDILKRRYARGEIDKDEFEAKKRDLLG